MIKPVNVNEQNIPLAKVKPNWNYWGLIDRQGNYIIEPLFHYIHEWKEGIALLEKVPSESDVGRTWKNYYNGQYGFVNSSGSLITDFSFGYANNFSNGLAAVNKKKKWGFISTNGNLEIPFQFEDIRSFEEAGCVVLLNSKWGLIDKHGKWKLDNTFESLSGFCFGMAVATKKSGLIFKDKHNFIIDTNGSKIVDLPKESDWNQIVSDKLVLVGTSSGYPGERTFGFMNLQGKIVTQPQFYTNSDNLFDIDDFSEDMLAVRNKKGLYGYVNAEGELVIKLQFQAAGSFSNGIAKVGINNEAIFIDKSGRRIDYSEPEEFKRPFDEVLCFSEGLAVAKRGELWGVIDSDNVIRTDFRFQRRIFRTVGDKGLFFSEYLPKYSCGLIGVNEERGDDVYAGYLDTKGEIAIDLKYRIAEPFILS
jgi:hypothetical protein